MKNFGFLSKKKVAREIAKLYNSRNNTPCPKEQFLRDCEVQSALNYLCRQIGVTSRWTAMKIPVKYSSAGRMALTATWA